MPGGVTEALGSNKNKHRFRVMLCRPRASSIQKLCHYKLHLTAPAGHRLSAALSLTSPVARSCYPAGSSLFLIIAGVRGKSTLSSQAVIHLIYYQLPCLIKFPRTIMTHPRGLPFGSHGLSPLFGLRRTSPSFGVLNQYVAVIDHDFMTRRAATVLRHPIPI